MNYHPEHDEQNSVPRQKDMRLVRKNFSDKEDKTSIYYVASTAASFCMFPLTRSVALK